MLRSNILGVPRLVMYSVDDASSRPDVVVVDATAAVSWDQKLLLFLLLE